MSEPLVIIGNGMAAARLVDRLTTSALGRYAIAVIGDEPTLAYNRVLLSSVLAGDAQAAEIELKPARWWRDRGVTLIYGRRATTIDVKARRVRLTDGSSLPYRELVLATGSRAIRLPITGMDRPGVYTFRDLSDVSTINAAAKPGNRVVVIGGGLLGLEAAYGVAKTGAHVTLIHLMDRLMERQLDVQAAAMLRAAVEALGVQVVLNADTASIEGRQRANTVILKDGRALEADMVVVAVGIRPNIDLAQAAKLETGRGIKVDDGMRTSAPGISAIGECAEHRGITYGLVEPAYEQASVLAARLSGKVSRYEGSVLSTNLKVSGVNVFSAGDFMGGDGTEAIVFHDRGLKTYKKLVLKNGTLVGAVLFGETSDGLWYLDLIRSQRPIAAFRNDLMFGRAAAGAMAA